MADFSVLILAYLVLRIHTSGITIGRYILCSAETAWGREAEPALSRCMQTPFMCLYAYLVGMEALAGGALDSFEPVRGFGHLSDQQVKGCPRTWRPEIVGLRSDNRYSRCVIECL